MMKTLKELRQFFESGHEDYRSGITIDCAIFGYNDGKLQLLLVKNKILTLWCLPGGYVKRSETLDEASARITLERTGIGNLFLKQFKTFGDPARNNAYGVFDPEKLYEISGIRIKDDNWLMSQTISVGFYAITDIAKSTLKPDILSSECRWFPIDELPHLGFDHDEMVREALFNMRMHLVHFPVGKNLLPEKFTLKEIKQFYEVISNKLLHATNFPNKLIKLGLIDKLEEKKHIGAHRSPTYYSFNNEVYEKALKEGIVVV
jgi:ADP-ribose pyrophosphatase YjhB (NUDIX family)